MKRIFILIIALTLFKCSDNPENYLKYINGYWEIEEVTLSDGNKKIYEYNDTVDYISISDSLVGFRKKLKPGFNDTYLTSKDAEKVVAKLENDSLNLYYSTPYDNWKETVLEATSESLKVINKNKAVYLYKRHKSFKLEVE